MLAVYKKEIRMYFNSMIAYIFIAFFLAIIGLYTILYNFMSAVPNFEYALASISFIFVVIIPILTMRIMAEEKRQKTDQLLFTSPLSITQIILGKFMAVFSMFGIVVLIISLYPVILSRFGTIPFKTAYSGIFGFLLMGAAYLALGLFISSLTESQVVSAVVCFVAVLLTILAPGLATLIPVDNKTACITFSIFLIVICILMQIMMHNITVTIGVGIIGEGVILAIYLLKPSIFDNSVTNIINWFSVSSRYDIFTMGMFDLSAIIYYLSFIFVFLFLTIQSIQKRRWN